MYFSFFIFLIQKLLCFQFDFTLENIPKSIIYQTHDDTIYNDSKELYGLKLFLQEFSRIDTKEVLEVHIWDEYLMFAYLFGIADKVAKQLKNLYPETLNNPYDDTYFDYNTVLFINNISTRSVSAASSARAAAESYSGGGGGFSSGGGGGGSFGGGGSMGGR